MLKKKGELLYQRVKDFEASWLSQTVQPGIITSFSPVILAKSFYGGHTIATMNERKAEGEKLLKSLKESWEDHNLCMNMITDVLMYMVSLILNGY